MTHFKAMHVIYFIIRFIYSHRFNTIFD